MSFKFWLSALVVSVTLILLTSCGGSEKSTASSQLPSYVQNAPHNVQVAYLFAIEHPEMLIHQPCYCGCGVMGHMHNLHCFIQSIDENGIITFDTHALGCGICVDIALDVKRLMEDGKSELEIRQYIDATYSPFGPPTDTSMPGA